MTSPRRPRQRARRPVALLVAGVLLVALAPVTRGPWRGSEQLVANARSASLARRLAVWSTDQARAGPAPVAWYSETPPVARRYVRLLPSALVSLEVATFGSSPQAIRLATLLLHLLACWLGLGLLSRFLGDSGKAAAVVLLLGLHGASFEIVSWESCQAIAVAAVLALTAATLHVDLRAGRRPAGPAAAGVLGACLLAMTSYEAAMLLPLALLLLDRELDREALGQAPAESGGLAPVGAPRWLAPALWALLAIYALLVLTLALTSRGAAFSGRPFFALSVLVFELAGYVARTLLYFPLGERVGGWGFVAVLAAFPAMHLVMRHAARRSTAALGVALYALFLAPPLLARATVSVLNRPTMRQLYLPLLGAALLLALVPGPMTRRRWSVVGAVVALVMAANVAVFVRRAPPPGYEALRASVRGALTGTDPESTVLVAGRARCAGPYGVHEYRTEYDAGAREVVQLLPLGSDGQLPNIETTGERTLVARATGGFEWAGERADAGIRVDRRPLAFFEAGFQETPFGRVEVTARHGRTIEEVTITLDRPLDEHVVLLVRGCDTARRLSPAS